MTFDQSCNDDTISDHLTQPPISSIHHSFDINLAAMYGVEEAILIHHFQHWIGINARAGRNERDGKTWTYQTRQSIAEHFHYWNYDKVKYLCEKLVKLGVLEIANYNKASFDKTLWYAFVDEKSFGIYKNPNKSYEGQKCPSKGKSAQPIPDTKPAYSKSKYVKEEQHNRKVADTKKPVVVPSYEEEKRAALARFCLAPQKLKEFMSYELNQIRDAILAYDQFAASNLVENEVGCLTNAIRGAWKPNLDAAAVKKIKDNLTYEEDRARKRILGSLKPLIEASEHKLKEGVKIKLTSHMVFLIYPHGQSALQLWNEDTILMVEYFLETNTKE